MKHAVFLTSIIAIILVYIFTAPQAQASFLLQPFGGKVLLPKAIQIQVLEATGFVCTVPGHTIQIIPVSTIFPSAYLIPAGVRNKTNAPISPAQEIKGLYSNLRIPIICVNSATGVTKTVSLPTIALYGTSIK